MAGPASAATDPGFLVQRFDAAPAGAGWLTQDNLNLSGGLGGAVSLTTGYAHNPLILHSGSQSLSLVTDQAHANIGFAITYDRYRLSFDLASPLYVRGQSGTLAGVDYTAPRLDIASHPDSITDVRIGLDARVFGQVGGPLRLGVGAQLFVPSADQSDYMSDGTYRGLLRVMAAGDIGGFTYAAMLGAHIRPLLGHEMAYGAGAGWRFVLGEATTSLVVGPELFGTTQVTGAGQTALEGLLTGRLEVRDHDGHAVRVKLGVGGGVGQQSGAAEWRAVVGVEVLGLAGAGTETAR